MNIHKQIVSNLKGRVHPVNVWTAIHGVEDMAEALIALQELTEGGRIQRIKLQMPNNTGRFPMYRLEPTFSQTKLAVDNTPKGQ